MNLFHAIGDFHSSHASRSPQRGEGSSLAVAQFVELVRGERTVRRPQNPFRVEEVSTEEHMCLDCFGVRTFDVIHAISTQIPMPGWDLGAGLPFRIMVCRCCGKVGVR